MALRGQASLAALTDDVVKISEIEGEQLNAEPVRSSIARRLGVDIGAQAPADHHVDGVVEMALDATANCYAPVTQERLFRWHAALFPGGYPGLARIKVGGWRDDASGPTQVVSGAVGRQRAHFEVPLLKAGPGHLWFITLHPFDDGNGRIARATGDLLLARADGDPQRFYSLSAQIQRERTAYYDILERTQKGAMDVTEWLAWFLAILHRAIDQAQHQLRTERLASIAARLRSFARKASHQCAWREIASPIRPASWIRAADMALMFTVSITFETAAMLRAPHGFPLSSRITAAKERVPGRNPLSA